MVKNQTLVKIEICLNFEYIFGIDIWLKSESWSNIEFSSKIEIWSQDEIWSKVENLARNRNFYAKFFCGKSAEIDNVSRVDAIIEF